MINDKIYVFGGFTNTSMEASLQSHVYDPSTDVWTRLADMPAKVTHYICARRRKHRLDRCPASVVITQALR